jgi:hypothetical protein
MAAVNELAPQVGMQAACRALAFNPVSLTGIMEPGMIGVMAPRKVG